MKKVILLIVCSFLFCNFLFVSAEDTCKEEVIKNASNPHFSKDWSSFLYVLNINWKYSVVKDWVEWKLYDYIINDSLKYSADWKSFSYIANKDWKQLIVKDWVEWKIYNRIMNL